MCRSRRELSNAYLLAKVGFDTAENEPFQVCPLSAYRSPRCKARVWRAERLASKTEQWIGSDILRGTCYLVAGIIQMQIGEGPRGAKNVLHSWVWLRKVNRDVLDYKGVEREAVRCALNRI